MKQYTFMVEGVKGSLIGSAIGAAGGTAIGAGTGHLIGLMKNQNKIINKYEKMFYQTSDLKYKIMANKIKEMNPEQFRSYITQKLSSTGGKWGAGLGLLMGNIAGDQREEHMKEKRSNP